MRSTDMIADLKPGDHLCCLYETEEEHRALLVPFLRQGLERGEKVLYIVDAHTAEAVLGYLRDADLEVELYLESGQLNILPADDAYTREGVFDPDGMIALLRDETERALAEGYPALRLTGEMTWTLRGLPGSERLVEYEARLNEFLPGSQCLAICQYDRRRFDPEVLLDVLRTHPVAVVGTEFYEDFYYMPPTEFLGRDLPAATLRHWLENLAERKRVEGALRQSEEQYRTLVEHSLQGIAIAQGSHPRLVFANPAMARILGYTVDELISLSPREIKGLVHPEDRKATFQRFRDLTEGKPVSPRFEYRVIRKDGTVIWLEASDSCIEYREQPAVQTTFVDITERKRAEEALRGSEEELRAIFDSVGDGIALIDVTGKVVRVNKRITDVGGYAEEEIVGKRFEFLKMFPPQSLAKMLSNFTKLISGRQTPPFEVEVYTKAGGRMNVELRGSLLRQRGKTVGMVGVMRDITERKRLEHEIEERRLYLENVLACAPDAIVTLDAQHRILEWNPGAEKLYGYTLEEVLGRNLDELITGANTGTFEEATGFTRQILAGKPLPPTETVRYRKEVSPVDVIASGAPILIGNEVVGVVAVYTDITERKRLEAQLRQAQKMEALGQLAGGICHDFNNLLTPISGFAELLLWKAAEGSQQHEYLRQIKIAADRAAALTHQLRLFTRRTEGERCPVQLNSVIEETRDLLEHSIPKEIIIELFLESELWAVETDSSQISQVLMNLCLNARDAMPDGGTLTLETRNVTLDEEYARKVLAARPGRYVCLSVSDTGCGMSPEVQARLFEPFFTTKGVGKGTGLGLAVVYGIVKGHDGFVNFYSEEGQGSTFRVYLPAVELAVEEEKIEVLDLPRGTETLLLVDDEETVLELAQRVLESCGYTVLTAENGVQALEVYQAHRGEIALVVLDVVMPEMGGRECLHRLQELDPAVRVLISTGYTVNGSVRELVSEGALGVVEKPFNIKDLATMVRAALDG